MIRLLSVRCCLRASRCAAALRSAGMRMDVVGVVSFFMRGDLLRRMLRMLRLAGPRPGALSTPSRWG